VLVHEEVHARDRGDEAQAYAAQLTTLNWLGSGVGTPLYNEVMRSMRRALARTTSTAARLAGREIETVGDDGVLSLVPGL
jgi:hypothetical protein